MKWFLWSVAIASPTGLAVAWTNDAPNVGGGAKVSDDAASRLAALKPGEPIGPGAYQTVIEEAADDGVPLPIPAKVDATPQGDTVIEPASGDPFFLGFAAGAHYPPAHEVIDPELTKLLRTQYADGRPTAETYAFVMFGKRMTRARIDQLEALGVRVLQFHPHYSMKVALTAPLVDQVAALDFVRWIGVPRGWQKVHPQMARAIAERVGSNLIPAHVNVFDDDVNEQTTASPFGTFETGDPDGRQTVLGPLDQGPRTLRTNGWQERKLEQLGLQIEDFDPTIRAFRVRLDPQSLAALVQQDFVQFVEPRFTPSLAHDESMPLVNLDLPRVVYDGDYSDTVVVGQADSGIEYSHPGITGFYWTAANLTGSTEGSTDDLCGHGSHVNGTMRGNTSVEASWEGAAMDLAQSATTRFFNGKIFYGGGCSWGGSTMSQIMGAFDNSITDGSGNVTQRPHVINHSWGTVGSGFFGTEADCRTIDASIYTYKQLHVFAAGNEGPTGSSIREEASAKNVLTVGSVMPYESAAGDPGEVSSSSSRGPTGDDRWKPNLCAPGSKIWSIDAASASGGYEYKSGTSMAAPHVTGLAAQLCDHASFFRYNPTTLSAVLMATAMTKDNVVLNSPSTSSTHHLNVYGAGRVEGYKAHYTSSQLAQFYWGWTQGTSGYNYVDVPISAGATRLVVCMNYHEPAASSGASQALVNDLDLWIDAPPLTAGGNTGEYSAQQSPRDNTEIRIIDNPEVGTWRLKVYSDSCTTLSTLGLAVSVIYGDTTPAMTLDVAQSGVYFKPGDDVDFTVTVDNPNYLASGVYLDTTSAGDVLQSSTTYLKGGFMGLGVPTDLMSNEQLGRDVVLGNIIHGDSRKAKWRTRWNSEGVKVWAVEARSENAVDVSASTHVYIDGTPPVGPTNLASTSHAVMVNDCDDEVDMQWTAATDAVSGLAGYIGVFDTSPSTIPTGAPNIAANATTYSDTITVGVYYYYFHLRAVDKSGNLGTTVHAGPFSSAGPPGIYCTAKVNSLGCTPAMSFTGYPSTTNSAPFNLNVGNVLNKKSGLLFYSTSSGNINPFQGGWLCMGGPIIRTNVMNSGGSATGSDCTGSYSFDFNALIQGGTDPNLLAGHKVRTQYWSRDPNDAFTTSLSNAVVFYICDY